MMVVMDKGERRHVKLVIHSCRNEEFEIVDAEYELKKYGSDATEDPGTANIIEHVIDIVVEPKEKENISLQSRTGLRMTLIEPIKVKVVSDGEQRHRRCKTYTRYSNNRQELYSLLCGDQR